MRKLCCTLAFTLLLFGTAHARFYISFPGSTVITGDGVVPLAGLALGTYDLYQDFGIRASAQTSTSLASVDGVQFVEGSVDGTYSFGDTIIFYTGAGLGYSAFPENGSVTLAGFVGLDFDADSVISIFLEVKPVLYIGDTGAVQLRSGLNFHIGGGSNSVQGECCVIP